VEKDKAIVLSATRRFVQIQLEDKSIVPAMLESRALDIVVGDLAYYSKKNNEYVVNSILPRVNCLQRCYGKISKKLAANLQHVFIITAVEPLFNTNFIDRISVAAKQQNIDISLVVNKIDLGTASIEKALEVYRKLGMEILNISAKLLQNFDLFRKCLLKDDYKIVALAGISGVGKSSILNVLIPDAQRAIASVSERSGQGKQTTSQSFAYTYNRPGQNELLVIDLPGLSSYKLTHLTRVEVRQGFPDFMEFAPSCQYTDCFHLNEPNCAVKDALQNAKVAQFRYNSYTTILDELEEASEY